MRAELVPLVGFLLMLAVRQGESLGCYFCDSDTTPGCGDPFDQSVVDPVVCLGGRNKVDESLSKFLKTSIKSSETAAETTCSKLKVSYNGATYVARGCSYVDDVCDMYSSLIEQQGGHLDECKKCKTDACNSSTGLAPFTLLLSLLPAALLLLRI